MTRWPTIATFTILGAGCFSEPADAGGAGSTGTTSSATETSTTTTSVTSATATGSTSTSDDTTGVADTGTTTGTGSTSLDASSSGDAVPSCEPGSAPGQRLVYINSQEMVQTVAGSSEFACEGFMVDPEFFGMWEPWGPLSPGTMTEIESHWQGYPVDFTYERPESPPYEMIIVTSDVSPVNQGFQTDASRPDCFNENRNSIGFAFLRPDTGPGQVASNVSQAVAWTLGLELSVPVPGEMPKEITSGGVAASYAFINECRPLVLGNECTEAHEEHCPAGQQNSAAELESTLAP